MKGFHMNQKIFLTYEQQLDKLKNDKGLTIANPDYAVRTLQKISYYSLIGGYKSLFKAPASGKYLYGVTFEEIVYLYYFDEQLRTIFLKYILHIEKQMKSLISYYFCDKYGENQQEYLNISNFTVTRKNAKDINRLIASLNHAISLPSNYKYITHHATKYHNVPLWVTVNAITFGQVSKLYQYVTNDVQYKISQHFEHVTERQLHQFMRVLTSCRNVCAHGERLYSFSINETISDTALHKKLAIPQINGQYMSGKHDLFSVVIALRYLLDASDFKCFKAELRKCIKNVLKHCPHLTENQLYAQMGFPTNWEKITLYKK
jgi:abortive infection bacteriophage resistance protein